MLSKIHDPNSVVEKECKRPRLTSTNDRKVNLVFGDQPRKKVEIPTVIDDYNNSIMNGVDLADQLRQYYTAQMPAQTQVTGAFTLNLFINSLNKV
ncbi:hypothetical protein BGZ76_006272 [Entomortierella beljakovae]|nr:hypothetical protein BGZ76_006272 [Entomortierella beljakovae]